MLNVSSDFDVGVVFYWSSDSKSPMLIISISERCVVSMVDLANFERVNDVKVNTIISGISQHGGRIISKKETLLFLNTNGVKLQSSVDILENKLALQKESLSKYKVNAANFVGNPLFIYRLL